MGGSGSSGPSAVGCHDEMTSPTAESTSALVRRWQQGMDREQGFRYLFHRFHDPLFKLFRSRGFAEQECQDLVQETFLSVFRGMASFRPEKRFESWLFTIAINSANRFVRRRSTKKRGGEVRILGEEQIGAAVVSVYGGDPGKPEALESLLAREHREILRKAVEDLPPRMGRCVSLRVFRDLSFADIAAVLKISESTAKVQLFQARKRLKESLGQYFDELRL